jgi:Glycosyltransferase family 87
MTKSVTTDKWLVGIAISGFVIYTAWTGFVVTTDRPHDYYLCVIAAHAFGNGANIYTAAGDPGDHLQQAIVRNDVQVYYRKIAGELGMNIWVPPPYQYPILTALVVYPLTFLPLRVGAAIWVGLSGLAALAAGLILCSLTNVTWKRRVIVAATVSFVPILTSMSFGQVNLFVLLATVLALSYLHQGKDTFGGVMLSVGIWLKPFAIALIPLLLWRRRWRFIGGLVVGSLLINLISSMVFGIQPILSQFWSVINVTIPAGSWVMPTIQNLNGFLGRLTIDLPSSIGFFLYLTVAGVLLGTTTIVIALNRNRKALEIESALLVVTTLLIAPRTWYHHLAMLALVFSFIVIYWDKNFRWNTMAIILLIGFLLTNIHGLAWKQLSGLHLALTNFPTLTALFLWCLLLTMLLTRSKGSFAAE